MDLYKYCYDNGALLVGCVKNVRKSIQHNIEENCYEDNIEMISEYEDLLQELEELKDNDIIMVNYDNGMGFSWDLWSDNDKQEIE